MATSDNHTVLVQCKCGKKFRLKTNAANAGFVCTNCGHTIQMNGATTLISSVNSPHWTSNLLWMIWAIPVCIALLGGLYIYNRERGTSPSTATVEPNTNQFGVVATSSPPSSISLIDPTRIPPEESSKDGALAMKPGEVPAASEPRKSVEASRKTIYWIGPGPDGLNVIRRANADMTDIQDIVKIPGNAFVLTADPVHNKLYWTTKQPGKLFGADLDGTNVEEFISSGIHGEQYGITSRPDGEFLFLCGHTFISKVSVNGWREIPLPEKPLYPTGIKANAGRGSVVWGVANTNRVYECNFDGGDIVELPGKFSNVNCPVIDSKQQLVYWIDYKTGELLIANFHGSGRKVIRQLPKQPQWSLCLDEDERVLYWGSADAIGRMPLDDPQADQMLHSGVAGDSLCVISTPEFKKAAANDEVLQLERNEPLSIPFEDLVPEPKYVAMRSWATMKNRERIDKLSIEKGKQYQEDEEREAILRATKQMLAKSSELLPKVAKDRLIPRIIEAFSGETGVTDGEIETLTECVESAFKIDGWCRAGWEDRESPVVGVLTDRKPEEAMITCFGFHEVEFILAWEHLGRDPNFLIYSGASLERISREDFEFLKKIFNAVLSGLDKLEDRDIFLGLPYEQNAKLARQRLSAKFDASIKNLEALPKD